MEDLIFLIKHLIVTLIRVFFSFLKGGEHCVVCDSRTLFLPVCENCKATFFSMDGILKKDRCFNCGKELLSTENDCMNCRSNEVFKNVNKILPLLSYKLWNKELLVMWKIFSVRSLTSFFASLVYNACKKVDIKIIVPVPPRPGKIKKEGWDQIDELCCYLQHRYKMIVLKLIKRNSLQEQKKLSRDERLNIIGKSYSMESSEIIKKELRKNDSILPNSVCLLDDVITTGSTVESCSIELKKIGIKEVNVLSLFYVD